MSNKRERQAAIVRLVGQGGISSQEELRRRLEDGGWQVTQATLSRDLRDLGILRAPSEDGARYLLPEMVGDDSKPSIDNLLPQFFSRIDGVSELIVVHTLPGGAQPIAEAVDSEAWPEVIGTLAGENTVLIVCRSVESRMELTGRLLALADQEPHKLGEH